MDYYDHDGSGTCRITTSFYEDKTQVSMFLISSKLGKVCAQVQVKSTAEDKISN